MFLILPGDICFAISDKKIVSNIHKMQDCFRGFLASYRGGRQKKLPFITFTLHELYGKRDIEDNDILKKVFQLTRAGGK